MLKLEEVYHELLEAFASRQRNVGMRDRYRNDTSAQGARYLDHYSRSVEVDDEQIIKLLRDLVRFPPHLNRQFDVQPTFYENGATYEDSVFIMTKFPRADLRTIRRTGSPGPVITHAVECVRANGYHPRIASEPRPPYHAALWDNVEAYLFCCGNGVAIVEDKYKDEFNPNVAMEWGWMRATEKRVLYLIEKDFKHLRADTQGLLSEEFVWDAPLPGIQAAITKYFPKRGG